ncbi:hypothetical protein H257_06030 [Aphanomyces astaci]|uniref:Uncharacterized protein n=1 Tax=Aphanomyces astaci TaxID=112090 RepID=W4GP89_APHAT|nr:hypothetical protein H257_06030 [Aphanomyces astaci]ETV81540.1 hypothetical protein H257_06030 [Aphanomyces astaci]|eukprot:XP_009829398.1 hypothetical protein H257_06030 [Aphanomyces astaci]
MWKSQAMAESFAGRRQRRVVDTAPNPIPKYKVLLVGGASVGKTSIFRRLLHTGGDFGELSPPGTVGVNIGVKCVDVEGLGPMVVELWDVPSIAAPDKSCQNELYFDNTHGILFVHSAVNRGSFQHLQAYHTAFTLHSTSMPVAMLVLKNKSDDTIDETASIHLQWLETQKIDQVNVSAKMNVGLLACLRRLLGEIATSNQPPNNANSDCQVLQAKS